MTTKPKPDKGSKKAEKLKLKRELAEFRQQQALLAIFRDNSVCAVCWFVNGVRTPRDDVHHVYGRGSRLGDWREQYTSLLCVCRNHHPLPIQTPGGNPRLAWVEDILEKANKSPINPAFILVSPL